MDKKEDQELLKKAQEKVVKCHQCGQEFIGGVAVLLAHYQLEHPEIKLTP